MENKKCSIKKHSEIEAIKYCLECKKYLCKKWQNLHFELFEEHNLYNLDKNCKDIFTGFCQELNHNNYELDFFCKTHNTLCCLGCTSKFERKGYGQHKNCEIFLNENIKDEKKNNLKENIIKLEELLKGLDDSIKKIKILFDKVNEDKEKLKLKIQKTFTTIRNALNDREDKLLSEIDELFNKFYFNEKLIKESGKLPNKVIISLEKGKLIEEEFKDDNKKLNIFINDCINIENNIKEINEIKEGIQKIISAEKFLICFSPDKDEEINKFISQIKGFGVLYANKDINLGIELNNYNIIKSINDIQFLIYRLKNEENSKISFNLLFKAAKDGENASDFHRICDGKSQQLIFIKTKNEEIFGGYTKIGFNSRGKYCKDNNAFVFSISKKTIYNIKNNVHAIFDSKERGPCFSGSNYYIISVKENMLKSKGNTCIASESNYKGISKDYEINNGQREFDINDIEVYQVLFN